MRKIIHIDMDAFYASVEQRDNPRLRGKLLIVAWRSNRSVVCAASHEARAFRVRSAMPTKRAERLCPAAVFVAPDFTRYREISCEVRDIFKRYTELIEPLSLDEAYLDVTQNKMNLPTATLVARTFLCHPARRDDSFLLLLPVGRLPGVGRVTGDRVADLGLDKVEGLRKLDLSTLEHEFGRYGLRRYELAGGIDESEVVPDRTTQSISVEDTLEHDVPLTALEPMIRRLAERLWLVSCKPPRKARTVILKLKTSKFEVLTRSHTHGSPPSSREELAEIALKLRERVDLDPQRRYRLVGIGLSNFRENEPLAAQAPLFE